MKANNREFMRREARCYKVDEVLYYNLKDSYIYLFLDNPIATEEGTDLFLDMPRVTKEGVDLLHDILVKLNDTNSHTSTKELAIKVNFIRFIKDYTPNIYEMLKGENDFIEYGLEDLLVLNRCLLKMRLEDAGILDKHEKLENSLINCIAKEGVDL